MNAHDTSSKTGPLSGIRVLDFTIMMAGPYATRYLADMGADVIKIEAPEGDYIRQREPLRDGCSAYFGHLNAGKRSVCLDLKDPASVAAVKKMVESADVVVENFRPGAMARLGLGYEALSAINPRLVYCSVSGFGQTGPDAERPAYAQIVMAASGYEVAFAGYQDHGDRPANTAIFIADVLGALFAYSGILAALNHRHATGRGQHVDTTLMENNGLWWMFTCLISPGAPNRDLYLFHSRDPLNGPWVPHGMNPVVVDNGCARMAGNIWFDGTHWMRPAQDCAAGYGGAVKLRRIVDLTPRTYCEQAVGRLGPETLAGASGVHTFNMAAGLQLSDARRSVERWRLC